MLGNVLKNLREKKGVTQDDIANLLNVKRQTYSAYERNVSVPDANTIKKLATFFAVSTDTLLEVHRLENAPQKTIPTAEISTFLKCKFIEHGILKEGEDLTDEQVDDYFKKFCDIINTLKK